MSISRICAICGEEENIRLNFGINHEAEREFHSVKYYCNDHKYQETK